MEFILPEIVSAGIFNAQNIFSNTKISKKRTTTMFEIEIPIEEGGISYINDELAQIEPSCVICAKPGQTRQTKLPFKCYYIHFILKNGKLYEYLMESSDFIKTDNVEKYIRIFEKIYKVFESPVEEEKILLHSLVMELIYMIIKDSEKLQKHQKIKPNNYMVIESAIKYINENISSDLSLENVARYVSMSPIHFHNCFKKATANTLHQYVESLRLKKAANMLVTTDYTLAKIAYECGFSSQAYFSYAFKKKMKTTPRKYSKSFFERYEKGM